MDIAILLAGHLRNYNYVDNIIELINLNQEYNFYIFILFKNNLNTKKLAHITKDKNYNKLDINKINLLISKLKIIKNVSNIYYSLLCNNLKFKLIIIIYFHFHFHFFNYIIII